MQRLVTLFLLLSSALALSGCVFNRPEPASGSFPRDVIVVTGEGEVMGQPDVARLQLGVEARARDAAQAVAAINTKAANMIEALKQLGIASEDLQTRDFNIHSERLGDDGPLPMEEPAQMQSSSVASPPGPAPKLAPKAPENASVEAHPPPPGPRPTEFVYYASNTVHVTVRDLAKLGEVLSRAVEAGANSAWGISFEIDDDGPLLQKARAEAVADARAQATELAKLAGVELGDLVSIADATGGGGPMPPMAGGMAMMEMRRVPTERGQLAVRSQVQVVFAIDHTK